MPTTRREKFAVVGAALALLLALLVLLHHPSFGTFAFGQTTNTTACKADNVHYYAYDAPAGSHQFGPAVTDHSVAAGKNRLQQKLDPCSGTGDPLFTATIVSFVNYGANLDPAQARSTAETYVKNPATWKQAVKNLNQEITGYEVKYENNTYETVSMIPGIPGNGKAAMPTLNKLDRPVVAGEVLVLHLKNGQVRELRYVCDLQPVAPHFPKIVPHPVPTTPPTPPCKCTTTHHPTTPPTCVCTHRTPPPSPCKCTTTQQVQIPVQESGQPTKAAPNAPASPPPTLEPGPGGNQPPPSTSAPNGYDPSEGTAPGGGESNGGSTTVNSPKPDPSPSQAVPTSDPTATGTPPPPG